MTTNTALADIPAAGAKALADYLNECRAHAIQPDIGGAFAYAFSAGAALTTAAAVPAEGMVMVPVEPTIAMCMAGDAARLNTDDATRSAPCYRAMLAAAPKAEPVPAGEYPPLPRPFIFAHESGGVEWPDTFDATQMRSYVDADRAMRAQAAPAAVAHIQQPFTLAEIKAKIASNDYSAELLLQHAMLLLDKPAAVAVPSDQELDDLWNEAGRDENVRWPARWVCRQALARWGAAPTTQAVDPEKKAS